MWSIHFSFKVHLRYCSDDGNTRMEIGTAVYEGFGGLNNQLMLSLVMPR